MKTLSGKNISADSKNRRSIKIRLYPNKSQIHVMENSFGIDRFVFNRGLHLKKSRWENHRENLSWMEISKMFTLMKKSEEYSFLNIASRSVIEQSLQKLDRAYQNFFKNGSGFPRFKNKNTSEKSFVLTDPSEIIGDKHIKLPKLGPVKMRGLRKFDGKIKNVTIKKNKVGQYFATFSVEDVEKIIAKGRLNKAKKSVGIDVNLENFLTDSNGNRVENPRIKKQYVDKINFYQRKLAKLYVKPKIKNQSQSRNYRKTKHKLAVIFGKISNKKSDFLHKLSNNYVKSHDKIVVENLQISNMVKNHKLAESISQASWGEFFRQLEYKCHWHGVEFIRVSPNYTSKTCFNCGQINGELKLKDRTWKCQGCDAEINRDENSAKNILEKSKTKTKTGRGTVRKACGGTAAQALPCETGNLASN